MGILSLHKQGVTVMAKQFFRVQWVDKVFGATPGSGGISYASGFLGCDMMQRQIIELLKEGTDEATIRVFIDLPGGPEVTAWQLNQAKKRMGRVCQKP
ncbi:MAG: hypothetical protein ACRCT2_09785 [Plesiomonas shigelloides]